MARTDRPGEAVGGGMPSGGGRGPQFSEYGLRRATNDLTKAEMQAEHKWRMKNDLDYKNQVARERAAKGTQAGHTVTDSTNHTKPVN